MAQFYHNAADKAEELAIKQTDAEREQAQLLFEQTGNAFYEISKLEDGGNMEQAKVAYDQVVDNILADPRFDDNQDVQDFYAEFKDYEPGLGKYVYSVTMYGQKAREQFQNERTTTSRTDKEDAIQARFESRQKLAREKEAATQARFEERMDLSQDKNKLTVKKFTVKREGDIIGYKRQEEKDLKAAKKLITKALTLAKTSKDFTLIDKNLQQSISKWENTSVRAYAELQRYDNYGNIIDRIAGKISKFFAGTMTDDQRLMVIETAQDILNNYINPALDESDDYWRGIASNKEIDPDAIQMYDDLQEIADDVKENRITRKQANFILAKPRFKRQLEKWQQSK
jgi:hypothetical protein